MSHPTAFTSYSWDDETHREWVAQLAARLRKDGVDVRLDRWHAVPGDQLPAFMEREIRENAFVIIICTPNYKRKPDARTGGVGYEGDIMTAEVMATKNHRKFIPVLAKGTWAEAAPRWLAGKYYVDLSDATRFERQYQDLVSTILGRLPAAPPLGNAAPPLVVMACDGEGKPRLYELAGRDLTPPLSPSKISPVSSTPSDMTDPVRILGVIVDEVTEPSLDGTRGCALYTVPFRLSRRPSREWCTLFLHEWQYPQRFTTMHRPGIASVVGDKIILKGTTIEEVKNYHRATLVLCVEETNRKEKEHLDRVQRENEERQNRSNAHKQRVRDYASGLDF